MQKQNGFNIMFTLNGNFLGNMYVTEDMMFCEVVNYFTQNYQLKEEHGATFTFNSETLKNDSSRKLSAIGIKNMSQIEVKTKIPINIPNNNPQNAQMNNNFQQMGTSPQGAMYGNMPGMGYMPNMQMQMGYIQMGYMPQMFGNMPQMGYMPQMFGNMPQMTGNGNMPQMTGNMPQATGNMPQMTGNMPQATGNMPQATGNMSQATGNMPQATGNIPQATGNMSQMTGNMTQATGNMPQTTGNTGRNTQNGEYMNIIFNCNGGRTVLVQGTKSNKFSELSARFCVKSGMKENEISYLLNGKIIHPTEEKTLAELTLHDQSKIEVVNTGNLIGAFIK